MTVDPANPDNPNPNSDSQSSDPPRSPANQGLETYNTIAETVGLIPSLRVKDNLIQAIVIGVITCISVVIGGTVGGTTGALFAALVGLVVSLLLSGFVLMILGWVRAIKKLG